MQITFLCKFIDAFLSHSLSPDRSSFHPFAQEDDSVSIVVVVGESKFPTNAVYKILLQS